MKLYFKIIFILFFCALVGAETTKASEQKEDSLLQILRTAPENKKADIYMQLARLNNSDNREKSVSYYSEALRYETDFYQKAILLDTIGLFNWQLGNYQEAITYFEKALPLFSDLKDSLWLGKVYNNLAVVNWGIGNSNEALKYYQVALAFRKAVNDQQGVSKILNNIGLIYQDWGLYKEAFEWHNNALKLAVEINDENIIAYSYSNIGQCYENLQNYETALKNYLKGYDYLLQKDENNRSNSFFSVNIGGVYSKMNKLDSALYHYQNALIYANRINNLNRITIAEYYLGETYFKLNELDSAKKYINKSYANSLEKNYTNLEKDNLFILAEIAEKEGKILSSLEYYKKANTLKDSLFNIDKVAKFTDLQIKYFTDQQEQENILLKKNNEIQEITIREQKLVARGLIIGGIFILIVLLIIARSRKSFKELSIKLEKSEKDLILANANKDKFFTIIAHDLKSPFNGLIGITDLLETQYDNLSPEKIKEMVGMVNKSSTNLYALLDSLLQWAQIQTGNMKYDLEKTDICNCCKTVSEQLKTFAENKKIDIVNSIEEGTLALADEKATLTILRNLVSNAIKYSHPGGIVTIGSKRNEKTIEISVADNGIGMDKSTLNKLFELTEKVSQTGTAQETGTGLGLILCKELIEKQNGKIWAKSTPGEGSIFRFTLPVSQN